MLLRHAFIYACFTLMPISSTICFIVYAAALFMLLMSLFDVDFSAMPACLHV